MTEWSLRFDYPAEEWLLLDMASPDGAKQVAQQVADRGGWRNKRYAKALYEEIKETWQEMDEALAELVVVYVPTVRLNTPFLSPANIHANWVRPDFERTLDVVMEKIPASLDNPSLSLVGEPEVTAVELPLGPACRVRRTITGNTGYEQLTMEYAQYYILQELRPEDLLLLTAFWLPHAAGPWMVDLADRMAATLTLVPAESGEGPRPVLDVPET